MKKLAIYIMLFTSIVFLFYGCENTPGKSSKTSETTTQKQEIDKPSSAEEKNEATNEEPKEVEIVDVCGNPSFDLMANIDQ